MIETTGFEIVVMSDLHLGMTDCKPKKILKFLNAIHTKKLILNGDIIDIDAINRGSKWKNNHTKVITKLLEMAKYTEIIYLRGNHDDDIKNLFDTNIINVKFQENYQFTFDNVNYLVFHGDVIDISTKWKFLTHIGSIGYDIALRINSWYNKYREWRNLPYLSISKIIKENFKEALKFINNFEDNAATYAKNKNCNAVICGHIHIPIIKKINNVLYLNSGDWVENFTALTLDSNGTWHIFKAD